MRIVSQPAEIAPDEAAARFTRATELLMRAAERRKAAQAAFATTPTGLALPPSSSGGRFVYHHAQVQPFPASLGGHA